ncbi:MAG TPA: DUF4397 domain-containing protein [Gemmatimonadales bacterium]
MHRPSLLCFVLLGGLACSGNPAAPYDPTGTGQLTMLNALVPGDPATVKVDGNPMTLPPAGQSGTAQLAAGAHQLQVLAGGGQVLTSAMITLTDGGHRTAVLSGAAGHNVLLVTTLDTASVPVLDAAKMRLVHTVAGAPAMDAYLFAVGQTDDSAARFVSPFVFGSGTDPQFPGYAVRPPGQYLVWLKAAGTETVLLQAGPFTVNAGDVYSFVLAQNAAGELELRAVKER